MAFFKKFIGGGGGRKGFGGFFISTFSGLNDVPHSYTGKANYVLTVDGTETGLTFVLGRGVAGGFASLDGTGKVPSSELPSIAISDFLGTAADQAAMLLLTGEVGDWCIRSDLSTTWIIIANDGSAIGDWQEISYPAQPYKVMCSATDLTPDYLLNKLTAGKGISISLLGAGDQDVEINTDLTWLVPVISIFDNTAALPVGPAVGDRYIAEVTANGWTENRIYEWDGAAWLSYTPEQNDAVVIGNGVSVNKTIAIHEPSINGTIWVLLVNENDARLTDSRTPTAHASTHNSGGSDVMAIDAAAGTGSLRTLGTGSTQSAAGNHTHTDTIFIEKTWYNPSGVTNTVNAIVFRAPYACTVTKVYGYRVGGTSATVNARKNGTNNHLSSDLSLSSVDTWMDGGTVQNATYAAGDKMEFMITAVAGSPTQIGIQVELTKTI